MRILFLTNLYPPLTIGGYELACSNVAEGLKKRGHQVRVLTAWCHLPVHGDVPCWLERGLDLHAFIPYSTDNTDAMGRDLHNSVCSSYANTLRVLGSVRDFRPDIVYVWNLIGVGAVGILDILNYVEAPWALHLMDRVPVEVVAGCPSHVLGVFNARGSSLYSTGLIFCMSQTLLDEIEQLSGISFPQGVELIPGWADIPNPLAHRPYLQGGLARFVAAGNVAPHKGIDLILEACSLLKGRGLSFSVHVFGAGELSKYTAMAHEMQVADCFQLLGPRSQSELFRMYAEYDAFLFPTWEREPFGFAAIEAAGCGTPPILTRHCGAAERLVDTVHCIKVDRTAKDLADAMIRVATGAADLQRIARAARNLVVSDLSFTRWLDKIETLLQAHVRPWRQEKLNDPQLPLLAFLKHNLSLSLRFG